MAAEPGKPEEQPVDDVWKAAAYGNMDKTKEFIEADPQLVNKPDATGYVRRPTTQIPERDLRSRPRCIHPSSSFVLFHTADLHRQAPIQTPPCTHTSPPPAPRVPHLTSPHERIPIHARRFLPLQWAALNNRVAVATYLIERGAAVNATDNDKQTPIHWASVRGSLPCAELLLRHGARLDQADCRGYDPVHVAAQYGHTGEFIFIPVRAIGLTR
jgi:palmitoyltransferase